MMKPPSTKGLVVIATLLVVVSLNLFYSEAPGDRDRSRDSSFTAWSLDPVLEILRFATLGAGIATAIGLWSARSWAFWSYLAWLLFFAGFWHVTDSRLGAGVWSLVAVAAARTIFLGLFAVYLWPLTKPAYQESRRRLAGSAE